jgi:S-adenosylmethionine:tRNA ribosyltransferase-isomerase
VSVAAFELTAANEASAPPAERDEVRLLVAHRGRPLVHDMFRGLPDHLRAGDLLVVNTSATLPAALSAGEVDVHLSTPLPEGDPSGAPGRAEGIPSGAAGRWVVELRRCGARYRGGRAGDLLPLPGGGSVELLAPYLSPGRLWIAALDLPLPLDDYLAAYGRPIAYAHLAEPRPLEDLQTVFADEPGSAEMPSAGRPFSQRVLDDLFDRGVQVAPLVLHTGVSSLELGERPYPERYRVPALTASRVNAHRAAGGRVIAVGTTVVRALETVADEDGAVTANEGWTRLVVTPERGLRAIDGLITGWHEPEASHLQLLEAAAGPELLERSYAAALDQGYLWHEFGDSHLVPP